MEWHKEAEQVFANWLYRSYSRGQSMTSIPGLTAAGQGLCGRINHVEDLSHTDAAPDFKVRFVDGGELWIDVKTGRTVSMNQLSHYRWLQQENQIPFALAYIRRNGDIYWVWLNDVRHGPRHHGREDLEHDGTHDYADIDPTCLTLVAHVDLQEESDDDRLDDGGPDDGYDDEGEWATSYDDEPGETLEDYAEYYDPDAWGLEAPHPDA